VSPPRNPPPTPPPTSSRRCGHFASAPAPLEEALRDFARVFLAGERRVFFMARGMVSMRPLTPSQVQGLGTARIGDLNPELIERAKDAFSEAAAQRLSAAGLLEDPGAPAELLERLRDGAALAMSASVGVDFALSVGFLPAFLQPLFVLVALGGVDGAPLEVRLVMYGFIAKDMDHVTRRREEVKSTPYFARLTSPDLLADMEEGANWEWEYGVNKVTVATAREAAERDAPRLREAVRLGRWSSELPKAVSTLSISPPAGWPPALSADTPSPASPPTNLPTPSSSSSSTTASASLSEVSGSSSDESSRLAPAVPPAVGLAISSAAPSPHSLNGSTGTSVFRFSSAPQVGRSSAQVTTSPRPSMPAPTVKSASSSTSPDASAYWWWPGRRQRVNNRIDNGTEVDLKKASALAKLSPELTARPSGRFESVPAFNSDVLRDFARVVLSTSRRYIFVMARGMVSARPLQVAPGVDDARSGDLDSQVMQQVQTSFGEALAQWLSSVGLPSMEPALLDKLRDGAVASMSGSVGVDFALRMGLLPMFMQPLFILVVTGDMMQARMLCYGFVAGGLDQVTDGRPEAKSSPFCACLASPDLLTSSVASGASWEWEYTVRKVRAATTREAAERDAQRLRVAVGSGTWTGIAS